MKIGCRAVDKVISEISRLTFWPTLYRLLTCSILLIASFRGAGRTGKLAICSVEQVLFQARFKYRERVTVDE